jgi:hypothetical protein
MVFFQSSLYAVHCGGLLFRVSNLGTIAIWQGVNISLNSPSNFWYGTQYALKPFLVYGFISKTFQMYSIHDEKCHQLFIETVRYYKF